MKFKLLIILLINCHIINSQIIGDGSTFGKIDGGVATTVSNNNIIVPSYNDTLFYYKGKAVVMQRSIQLETQSLLNRYEVPVNNKQKFDIDSLIVFLKDSSLFEKFDILFLFNLHDLQACKQNVISNTYNITELGVGLSPTLDHGQHIYATANTFIANGYDSAHFSNFKATGGTITTWFDSISSNTGLYWTGINNIAPQPTPGNLMFSEVSSFWGTSNKAYGTLTKDTVLFITRTSATQVLRHMGTRLASTDNTATQTRPIYNGGSWGIFSPCYTSGAVYNQVSTWRLKFFGMASAFSDTDRRRFNLIMKWWNNVAKRDF